MDFKVLILISTGPGIPIPSLVNTKKFSTEYNQF